MDLLLAKPLMIKTVPFVTKLLFRLQHRLFNLMNKDWFDFISFMASEQPIGTLAVILVRVDIIAI